ncbi:hypothetical protein GCM10007049_18810 [Echinicola pacifica]|uniref:Uncharacterized protein n=1 Tax=Echinicola pacifica TaxID=346377 RepID=A0A918PXB9_9BACT|nr:hypothetical protein [Echinicola pacifica]GGZ26376.1 hypothetical protein GCM10007049_18810 [Echinicola pacifica]
MRVVKELSSGFTKITVFSWNNKYLIKYEQGMLEQTYKVNEMDILEESDLEIFYSEDFVSEINKKFEEMGQLLRIQLENI